MRRKDLVSKLLAINTPEADEAIRFLSVCDDVFSEMHAVCHARCVLAGEKCGGCTDPLPTMPPPAFPGHDRCACEECNPR
jgi:hypothetical protein